MDTVFAETAVKVRTDEARFVNLSSQATIVCVSSIRLYSRAANMRQSRPASNASAYP